MNATVNVVMARNIKAGSLAVLVFSGTAMLMVPLSVFFGVLAVFGMQTVHLNGTYVTGLGGLVLSVFYGVLFTGLFGLFAWGATCLAVRVVGFFRPFRLEYEPVVLPPVPTRPSGPEPSAQPDR